jgi:hypothetical protein
VIPAGLVLKLLGAWRWWLGGLIVLAVVASVFAWGSRREAEGDRAGYSRGKAEVQAVLDAERIGWAGERAAAAEAARLAAQASRLEEQRRTAALQEAIDAAELVARRERADRVIADAASGQLRERLAAYVTAARFAARHPGLALGGPAAEDPAGVLADVLGRCETRVRQLAAVADERGRAGQLCERAYDALTPGAPVPAAD